MLRRVMVVGVLALAWATTAQAATPQQLTIAASDGAKLACSLVEPDGTAPAAGWPAVMLFHGLGGVHQDMEPLATQTLAPAGYASLECDARGHGASEGLWALAAPPVVQDVRDLFAWLTARPEISDTQVGALGISLGGGTIWNAAAAGVPFKAIVPMMAWTDLQRALAPQGLPKTGLILYLSGLVPLSKWSPILLAGQQALVSGDVAGIKQQFGVQSSLAQLPSLTTPTLMIQGRRDFLFDIDQATTAYRLLKGPKRLFLGNLGHAPGTDPRTSPDAAVYWGDAVKWFDRYLKGTRNGVEKTHVELAHAPWDGKTTTYAGLPPVKSISVNLPGTTAMSGTAGKVVRGVRITGGPHETFGDTTVSVRYSHAVKWDRLVAVLCVAGSSTPISEGGAKVTGASGTATITLMNQAVQIPAGKRLVLYLGSTSLVQSAGNGVYVAAVSPDASMTVGRVTLKLSVLQKAVSK